MSLPQRQTQQRGMATLFLVITLLMGAAAVFFSLLTAPPPEIERDRKTEEALAQAKAALIGHAVSLPVYSGNSPPNRLGDLPCPDTNNDGIAESSSCGNAAGTTGQALRLGRLPWRTLGLPDLRDGDGERLWYAVSNNFKNNTRTNCNLPGNSGCLNSDTRGTITIRNSANNIIYDASNTDPAASGVIAVIFAPGAALRRQGAAAVQDRTCTFALCTGIDQDVCNAPVTNAPKCNPANYLDTNGTEDNKDFIDGSATNGFIQGIILDASGNVIVNDRAMLITYQDIMPQLEKRVAAEALKCLTSYANANGGRYPWAAPVTTVSGPFDGVINTLFGRMPDSPLLQTQLGIIPPTDPVGPALQTACNSTPAQCMGADWPASCPLLGVPAAPVWWNHWKLHVFYGFADAYKPLISFTQPTPITVLLGGITPPTGCPNCITIDPPSFTADKRVTVIIAGRQLPTIAGGQPRTGTVNRQNPANYLEGGNDSYPTFTQQPGSATFNDMVIFK